MTNFKFADDYLDASGYYQFGVRYYDPTLGRWTQQDPVGGSLGNLNSGNRYTYVEDDPVNLVDPSGKNCLTDVIINVIGGALGTLSGLGGALYGLITFLEGLPEGLAAAPEIVPTVLGVLAGVGLAISAVVLAYGVAQAIDECSGIPFVFTLF